MNSIRFILQKNTHQLRQFHKCYMLSQTEAAVATNAKVEMLTFPASGGAEKPVSPKIDKIAQEITALNLIEVAELSDILKKRLNLPDAPVMPVGGFVAAPKEEDVAPVAVKSSFTVKLSKFDEKQKVAIIKEIKNLVPGTNLVQAKKFIESLPQVVRADVSKDEAEMLKETLTKVGGEVIID